MKFRCPNCNQPIDVQVASESDEDIVTCPSCATEFSLSDQEADDATRSMELEQGRTIGRFEVRGCLGRGSFGVVYRAWDPELNREVAVKTPHPWTQSSRSALREARAAAAIAHPHVVAVHEIGRLPHGYYIACELVEGGTLKEYLAENHPTQRQAAVMIQQVLQGVAAFHERQVIHRDLKPSNILLDEHLRPKVSDFGLARHLAGPQITLTRTGKVLGTPAYMPPEQARGEHRSITVRSDVYSIGAVLYEMLTGRQPFQATDSQTMLHQVLHREPAPPRRLNAAIDRDLETICLTAMQKTPERRYASAREMADDLQRYLDGRPIRARSAGVWERTGKWLAKRKVAVLAAASTVVALLLLALLLWSRLAGGGAVPPGPPPQDVRIACVTDCPDEQAAIRWAFAPLDDARQPVLERRVFAEGRRVAVRLPPANYLIEVEVEGWGFQEVFRHVPRDEASAAGSLTPTAFQWERGAVVLPDVRVASSESVVADMVLLPGGELRTGTPGNPFTPPATFVLEDFYIQRTEVTYRDFTAVLPPPVEYAAEAAPRGDLPVVSVRWNHAAHYAEAIHCRLMTEMEWEFAATNRGTTVYPWGDAPEAQPAWVLTAVGEDTTDVSAAGVRGLFSNAAELTSSVLAPYPGGEMLANSREMAPFGYVFRGGPSQRSGLDAEANWSGQPQFRGGMVSLDSAGDNLGFRCARSARPRLLPPAETKAEAARP